MRAIILCSILLISTVSAPSHAQSLSDIINAARTIAEIESRNAEKEKEEQRRRDAEERKRLDLIAAEEKTIAAGRQRTLQAIIASKQNVQQVITASPEHNKQDQYIQYLDANGNMRSIVRPLGTLEVQPTLSVMAKDYWVKVDKANVYSESNNIIGTLAFSTPITTYGEKGGKGKISLLEEKWVDLISLSPHFIPAPNSIPTNSISLKTPNDTFATGNTQEPTVDTPVAPAKILWINTNDADIFDGSGTVIGSLKHSSKISVYEEKLGFVRINQSGDMWVKANETSKIKPPATLNEVTENKSQNSEKPLFLSYVNTKSLNVRDSPNGKKISRLPYGEKVTAFEREGGWVRISKSSNPPSWVSFTHLQSSKPQPWVKKLKNKSSNYTNVKLNVPSDPKADYYLLELLPMGNNLSIVNRREGPSGQSFSKREINCRTTEFRYLGDGNTIKEMNSPYNVKSMRKAIKGNINSNISYDILKEVCLLNQNNNGPIQVKKPLKDKLYLTRYVKGTSLNYRDTPNGNTLGSLSFATKVIVYDRKGNWSRISSANQSERWVHGNYLLDSKPVLTKNRPKPKSEIGYPIYSNSMNYRNICSFSQMESYLAHRNNSAACEHVLNQTGGVGGGTEYFDKLILRAFNSGR